MNHPTPPPALPSAPPSVRPPRRSSFGHLSPLVALLALGACASPEIRDDTPGRAQAFPPVYTRTLIPGGGPDGGGPDGGGRRTWSGIQAEDGRASAKPPAARSPAAMPRPRPDADRSQEQREAPPPRHRRGSSSPPPDPAAMPQPPRPVPLPPPASTRSATDAFKRDLIRPEVDRMRTDDAMGRLDPLGQRDLMKRENDLRQWGDPLAR